MQRVSANPCEHFVGWHIGRVWIGRDVRFDGRRESGLCVSGVVGVAGWLAFERMQA